jgi:PAS domain S-box-containing protein
LELTSTNGPDAIDAASTSAAEPSLSVFETSPVAIAILKIDDGVFLDANQSFLDLTGWSREQLLGRTTGELALWPDPEHQQQLQEQLATGQPLRSLQEEISTCGGALRTVLAAYTLAPYDETEAIYVYFWDVSERQERASQQAELMELAVNLRGGGDSQGIASIAIVYLEEIFQTEGALIAVARPGSGEAIAEVARGRGEELLAPLYARRIHRRALAQAEPYVGLAHWTRGERPWAYCLPLPAAAENMGVLWLFTAQPLPAAARSLLKTAANLVAAALYRAHLRSESDEETHQLRLILEAMPAGVALLDSHGYVLLANAMASYFLNLLAGGNIPEPLADLGGRPLSFYEGASGDDPLYDLRVGDQLISVRAIPTGEAGARQILILADATRARRQQSQQLVESRLASVGRLAAGIAHEFNNVMASVTLDTDLLLRERDLSAPAQRRLQRIHDQVQRGARLVQQVLDFSERSLLSRELLSLGALIRTMEADLRAALPQGVRLILPEADGYWIEGDAVRLETLLRNLAQNAAEAMPNGGELELTLSSATPAEVGPALNGLEGDAHPKRWVRLAVRDTGHGISARDIDRLFDPFFTTANPLAHRGLGLPQAYGIARQHGGVLRVDSVPGEGATFTVYLPAAEKGA